MNVVRRRLFWKIYITLLVSLVATAVFMGTFFWFLSEAQRDSDGRAAKVWPSEISLYEADGRLVSARGRPIMLAERPAGRHWGPGHVLRLDLPDGRIALTRFEPSPGVRAWRIAMIMLVVAGGVGLAAYPVTALLTRRLEALRAGVARWGEVMTPVKLDDSGSDEVALLAHTFNTAAARLDALLTSQKTLLANASHELRSPLARLRVAVEVGDHDRDAATHREIVQNLDEMNLLVDELLLSSRLDHPEAPDDRRETIDLLGLAAEEAAHYDAVVTGEPATIVGDAVLLRRLVRNLLDNGTRHGRPPVTIAVSQHGGGAMLVVGDDGNGIPVAHRDRIFEPFFRPAGSGEAAGGWGLGLALVRQIARRHGGDAECVAAPDGGSCFVIRLGGDDAGRRAG